MKKRIETFEDASDLLIDVLQREINRSCGVPKGYNADIEMEDAEYGLVRKGISVTDPEGNRVGGIFKDEDEVREYFRKAGLNQEPTWDELADEYVKSVIDAGNELTWDIVRTAFCAGMEEMSRRNELDCESVRQIGTDGDFEVKFVGSVSTTTTQDGKDGCKSCGCGRKPHPLPRKRKTTTSSK